MSILCDLYDRFSFSLSVYRFELERITYPNRMTP